MLDGTIGGVLLLELFKRDGMGTMVARYEIFLPYYICHNFFFPELYISCFILGDNSIRILQLFCVDLYAFDACKLYLESFIYYA